MNGSDMITKRQLAATAFVCLLSPGIRLLPLRSVQLSGNCAWVSPLLSVPIGILYICMIENLIKNKEDNEGLSELIIKSLGNIAGKIVLCIFVIWFVFYSGFILRSSSERMLSSVYASGNVSTFALITLAVSLVVAFGQVKSLARTGQVFVLIILVMLLGVLAFSVKDIKKEYILPVTYMDTGRILLAILPEIDIIGAYSYFLFLADHQKKGNGDKKTAVNWMLLLGVVIFLIEFITIGTLSAEYIVNNKSPFFIMIRNIVIFGIIERIEAVVVVLWVLTDFLFLAVLLMISRKLFGKIINVQNDRKLLLPLAAIIYLVAIYISKSAFAFNVYSEWIVPVSSMIFSFIVLPIVLIIGRVRKRI